MDVLDGADDGLSAAWRADAKLSRQKAVSALGAQRLEDDAHGEAIEDLAGGDGADAGRGLPDGRETRGGVETVGWRVAAIHGVDQAAHEAGHGVRAEGHAGERHGPARGTGAGGGPCLVDHLADQLRRGDWPGRRRGMLGEGGAARGVESPELFDDRADCRERRGAGLEYHTSGFGEVAVLDEGVRTVGVAGGWAVRRGWDGRRSVRAVGVRVHDPCD